MLIAVDTNIPVDLASGVDDVADALAVIRRRVKASRVIASPTVNLELAYLSQFADEPEVKAAAQDSLRLLWRKWKIEPVNLVPVGHGIVEVIGAKIRSEGLIPAEETHDSFILAEAALLGCGILLTSDAHLRGMDFQSLTLLLQGFDVAAPVIATPREIVREFHR